jgi:hypothetical protein
MSMAKARGGTVMVDGEGQVCGEWQCCSQRLASAGVVIRGGGDRLVITCKFA